MGAITEADLVTMATVWPELEGLRETDDEWVLGMFYLDRSRAYAARTPKTWPQYRTGYAFPVRARMRVRTQPFVLASGTPGVGVVVENPDDDEEIYVGWVKAERAAEAIQWVATLNDEIQRLIVSWEEAGAPGRAPPRT
jgi:hypothetical protein